MAKTQNIRWMPKAEFARLAGRSKAAITTITKTGRRLSHAVKGTKVDMHDPEVAAYLAEALARATTSAPGVPLPDGKKLGKWLEAIAEDPQVGLTAEEFEALTMREVAMRYGTLPSCKAAVDILKGLTAVKNQDVIRDERRGLLVRRSMVEGALLSLVDLAFKRIVEEMPLALAAQCVAIVRANGDTVLSDVTEAIQGEASRTLKACKVSLTDQFDKLDAPGK